MRAASVTESRRLKEFVFLPRGSKPRNYPEPLTSAAERLALYTGNTAWWYASKSAVVRAMKAWESGYPPQRLSQDPLRGRIPGSRKREYYACISSGE